MITRYYFDSCTLQDILRLPVEDANQIVNDFFYNIDGYITNHARIEFERNYRGELARQYSAVKQWKEHVKKLKRGFDFDTRHFLLDFEQYSERVNKVLEELTFTITNAMKEYKTTDSKKWQAEFVFRNLKLLNLDWDQSKLDQITKEASKRTAKGIGPGLYDQGKRAKDGTIFNAEGLAYDIRYGDYYIWRQILDDVAKLGSSEVVFVTSERKGDWESCYDRLCMELREKHKDTILKIVNIQNAIEKFSSDSSTAVSADHPCRIPLLF